jgi:hypothetical protein
METQSEKRKFQRVATHIPVKFRRLRQTEGTDAKSTITRNLSEGGVRFKSDEFISRACRLVVELDMPMFTKPVKAISKVAWIKKSPNGEDFEIGNQFLEISKEDSALVAEYVKGLTLYNEPDQPE